MHYICDYLYSYNHLRTTLSHSVGPEPGSSALTGEGDASCGLAG